MIYLDLDKIPRPERSGCYAVLLALSLITSLSGVGILMQASPRPPVTYKVTQLVWHRDYEGETGSGPACHMLRRISTQVTDIMTEGDAYDRKWAREHCEFNLETQPHGVWLPHWQGEPNLDLMVWQGDEPHDNP